VFISFEIFYSFLSLGRTDTESFTKMRQWKLNISTVSY